MITDFCASIRRAAAHFRQRTFAAANGTMVVIGAAAYSQFFLLIRLGHDRGAQRRRPLGCRRRFGLVTASRQIGTPIGLAGVSAVAAASTSAYADSHLNIAAASAAALDHGFPNGFHALVGLLLVGMLIAATLVMPRSASVELEPKCDQQPEALHETG
jgi:hypothetical protein